MPPLRDRKEDIPELLDYFVDMFAKKMGRNINNIDANVYEQLKAYHFPGNIRELRNIVERAIILCNEKTLGFQHFSIVKQSDTAFNLHDEMFDLEEIEKRTIMKALEKSNFNKSEAARLLNIEWNALHRRLQKFKL